MLAPAHPSSPELGEQVRVADRLGRSSASLAELHSIQGRAVARLDFGWSGTEASILVPFPGFE